MLRIIKIFFVLVFVYSLGYTQPVWQYNTTANSSIIRFNNQYISVENGFQITYGDFIGAFYKNQDTLQCIGAFEFLATTQNELKIYGYDGFNVGPIDGDTIYFKVWRKSVGCISDSLVVAYHPMGSGVNMVGKFISGGLAIIDSLAGINSTFTYISQPICGIDTVLLPKHLLKPYRPQYLTNNQFIVNPVNGAINPSNLVEGLNELQIKTMTCMGSKKTIVEVLPTPKPVITGRPYICSETENYLNVEPLSDSLTYLWNNGETSAMLLVSDTGWYSVKVTSQNGCFANKGLTVKMPTELNVSVTKADYDCDGVFYKANGNAVEYTWSNNQSGNISKYVNSGTQWVIAKGPEGCEQKIIFEASRTSFSADSIQLKVLNPTCANGGKGEISVMSTPDHPSYQQIELQAIRLSDSKEYGTYNHFSKKIEDLPPGEFQLKVYSVGNCIDSITNTIELKIPMGCANAIITPNNDGLDDVFIISNVGEYIIISPNGQKLKQLTGPTVWDATDMDGTLLATGLYYLLLPNGEVQNITLVR